MTSHNDCHVTRRVFSIATSALIAASAIRAAAADEPAVNAGLRLMQPPREKPQPGSVRLKNSGLIYSGMCSSQSSLAPEGTDVDQRLELRMIDQGARRVYVSNRTGDAPVVNPLDWPSLTFEIKRRRQGRKPLPKGHRIVGAFDASGQARGEIVLVSGEREEFVVAITKINEVAAEVTSLTHDLTYSVAIDAIPRMHLVSGILPQVEGFATEPFRRLELVRMLMKADRIPEAGLLLQTLSKDFPEFAEEQAESQQSVRETLAQRITSELELLNAVGQHRLAANGARLHPRHDLTPETVVRVTQLINEADDRAARIAQVRSDLPGLVAELTDDGQRQLASELVHVITSQLDHESIERLAAYELVARPDGQGHLPPAEERLALAGSGWLMGATMSLKRLPETLAVFQVQQLAADYLASHPAESEMRRELVERILPLEGMSIERLAAVVRHMPSPRPIMLDPAEDGQLQSFQIAATSESAGAVGFVPPEYSQSRHYPMVIAFSGDSAPPDAYLAWWQNEAVRNGYIVVVPIWHSDAGPDVEQAAAESEPQGPVSAGAYEASARQHRQFSGLVRQLKLGLRVNDSRVFVAGHGFGGEAAMDLAVSHPDLFAGIISICGAGRKHLQWTAWNAIDVPWYIVIGDQQPGWFERMGVLAAKLFHRASERKMFADVVFVKYPGRGFESYHEEADDIFRWMAPRVRARFPERIAVDLLRSTDLDWYWLRVHGLPDRFAQLDEPSTPLDAGYKPATLKARRSDNNALIIESAPDGVDVFLAPEMPGYDIEKPLSIIQGRNRQVVTWQPDMVHLLERLYETGDRDRLCFLRVTGADRTGRR